jgi:hypothetical protein
VRLFDLDHARAFIGEELGAEGAGQHAGKVGDDDAVQREALHRYVDFN